MSLPRSTRDASLAGTYEARPGVSDANPTGVASSNNQALSTSVKNSLDAVADSPSSTPSVSEKLPSAQGAAEAVKSGVSSLLAGVSNLALGVNDAVAQNASAAHPESHRAEKADDLHIPGAFEDATSNSATHPQSDQAEKVDNLHIPGALEDATSDSEDIAVVKDGVKSAYNTLPSTQDVKNTLPNTDALSEQIPSNPLGSLTNQSQGQQATGGDVDSLAGSSRQGQIHKDGIDHIKEKIQDRNIDSMGGRSQQGQIHQDGINHIKEQIHSQHIMSTGPDSTTSHLAGQVPLEPRGVPQIVADSQRAAGVSPEAAANPEAVAEKKQLEQELKRGVPETTIGAAGHTGSSAGLDRGVPQVVADSQKKADASPEASANAEAVREKQEVERQLKREIAQQSSADNTNPISADIGEAVSGGLASAGAAIAGAATYARQKTHEATGTDPVAVLPLSAQEAIDGKSTSTTASRSVATGQSSGQSLTDSLSAGASSVGTAVAGAASYAREKTHEATGTDPVAVLPASVQQSIDGGVTSDTVMSRSQASGSPSSRAPAESLSGDIVDGIDLHAGVHNGVVGDHLDDDSRASHRPSSGSHSGHWQPGTSATVAHIPSLRDVDLSAGVKNTVVGSGADGSPST